jgi:hypothetical protein
VKNFSPGTSLLLRSRVVWPLRPHTVATRGSEDSPMALGISLGVGLGAASGTVLFGEPSPGIVVGAALGAAVGAIMQRQQ